MQLPLEMFFFNEIRLHMDHHILPVTQVRSMNTYGGGGGGGGGYIHILLSRTDF